MPIPVEEWKWFGNPGHFICAQWCRFHLCTQVGKYLVSTVGEYVHPRHSKGSESEDHKWTRDNWPGEDLGPGRKYETMVFYAGDPCTAEGCMCGTPNISGVELDSAGYTRRKEATEGHRAMCEEYANKEDDDA